VPQDPEDRFGVLDLSGLDLLRHSSGVCASTDMCSPSSGRRSTGDSPVATKKIYDLVAKPRRGVDRKLVPDGRSSESRLFLELEPDGLERGLSHVQFPSRELQNELPEWVAELAQEDDAPVVEHGEDDDPAGGG